MCVCVYYKFCKRTERVKILFLVFMDRTSYSGIYETGDGYRDGSKV